MLYGRLLYSKMYFGKPRRMLASAYDTDLYFG